MAFNTIAIYIITPYNTVTMLCINAVYVASKSINLELVCSIWQCVDLVQSIVSCISVVTLSLV